MSNLILRLEFLAQSLFRQQTYCPHCYSTNVNIIAKKYLFSSVKLCNLCNLYFTSPIYQPLFSDNMYDYLYVGHGQTTALPSDEELTSYIEDCFRSSNKYFGDRIKIIKDFRKNLTNEKLSLLEIGSSWGYFVYQASQQGFDATGVELSEPRRLFGNKKLGVNIVKNVDSLGTKKFDVIYTAHCLEHFTDLSTIFKDMNCYLKIGGKVFIEVPNFAYDVFGDKALAVVGAVHPLGFSREFFYKNLPKYGFKILSINDSWNSLPDGNASSNSLGSIILVAEKEFSLQS